MKKLFLILPLILVLGGCTDPYRGCLTSGNAIAQSITAAMQTVDTARSSGLMSVEEEANVEGFLEYANKADAAFLSCAATAKGNGGVAGTYTACASTFASALTSPSELELIKVSNPQAQQTVTGIVTTITAGASSIIVALKGA